MPELNPFVPTEEFYLDDGLDLTDPRNRRRVTLGRWFENAGLPDPVTGRGTFTGQPMAGLGPLRRYETPEDYPYPGGALEAILPETDQAQAPLQQEDRSSAAMRRLQELRAPRQEEYKPSWKRMLLAGGLGFAGGLRNPALGAEITRSILMRPYQQATGEYEREREELERQIELERAGTEETRKQEAHKRAMGLPVPETPEQTFARLRQEAEQLGLKPGTPEYNEYISGRELGYRPERPTTAGIGRVEQAGNRLKQFNPETGKFDIDVGPAPPKAPPDRDRAAQRRREIVSWAEQARRKFPNNRQAAENYVYSLVQQGKIDPELEADIIRHIRLRAPSAGKKRSFSEEFGLGEEGAGGLPPGWE